MQRIDLNGTWSLEGGDLSSIPAQVPGNVHSALLASGEIPDPYYGDQELASMWIGERDWTYRRKFQVPAALLSQERVLLCCQGLDTLATITLNGTQIGQANNMFRAWEFDVKERLKPGENSIQVHFQAPVPYGLRRLEQRYIHSSGIGIRENGAWTGGHRIPGGNYLRKQASNYGWDWGPKVPTCGIWRDIGLIAYTTARLEDVHILQAHEEQGVTLTVKSDIELPGGPATGENAVLLMTTVSLEGEIVAESRLPVEGKTLTARLDIPGAQLWWPNGMGAQPLYRVAVRLETSAGALLDAVSRQVGLRTLRLVRQPDRWGEGFHFRVNGAPFFAKGANWIPADSFLDRLGEEDYERLIGDAAAVNMNMLRVWGGGIYEEEIFYDLCDRYGICVWQDFMFACATYPTFDQAWMDNVRAEAEDNVRRLRHHACLALWCGNNEIEQGFVGDTWSDTTMSWEAYGALFDVMLPEIVARLDPQTDYWPASPHTPAGDRYQFNDPNSGDAHIWDVWHRRQPFEYYRTCMHRFCSEFGFQSFPEPRTVYSYAAPQERNVTSYVMEHHQRSAIGNQTIMHYMLDWFRLPESFEGVLWLSQILQGMAVKYAVEHWRRIMPRSMGTLYWQLNDCWPVASWASIDYYGRWKALHYMARHFFSPMLISGLEDWRTGEVEIHVTSDLTTDTQVEAIYSLLSLDAGLVAWGHFMSEIPAQSDAHIATLDLGEHLRRHGKRNLVLQLELKVNEVVQSRNLVLFCRPKHLALKQPSFTSEIIPQAEGVYTLKVTSDQAALWAWVDMGEYEGRYSDNFIHLLPGETAEIVLKPSTDPGPEALLAATRIRSLMDTYR